MKRQLIYHLRVLLLLPAILFSSGLLTAQSVQVKGKVTDAATKKPLEGVSVSVRNAAGGTVTNASGEFALPVTGKNILLAIKSIGYDEQLVTASGNFLLVELIPGSKQLDEVTVTALGVKKETKRLGYVTQEVKGEDLTKARDANPITGLTGKIAGLSVGPSAELLRKPLVLLRGNEITLYVVDGIPISSDTWNISPDDIETYTVLKGPSAAALYGSRAQNGAILISTKKGNKRKGYTVEFNSSNQFDKGFLAFPRTQDKFGAGENTYYQFVDGKGGAPGGVDGDYDVWGPYFNGQLIPQYDSPVDPVTGVRKGTPYVARGTDNLKRFLQTGFQTTNNLSLSASGDDFNLRFSLSHSYQKSQIPNNYLNITNFNLYGSYNPSKRLKLEANLNFNRQYTPNFPDVDYGPNSLIYNVAVWTGADWNIDDMRNYWQPGKVGIQSVFAEYQRYHNPYFQVNEWLRGHYKNDIYGYFSGNYKIDNHLNATLRTQITTYNLLRTEKLPFSAHPYGREGNQGDYREDRRNLFENNTELQLNFNYKIKQFVSVNGLLGTNLRTFNYNSNWTSTDYLNVPNVYSFSNSKNPVQASSFQSDMRVLSGYYSMDASFGKYATISTTGRVDKSSALPVDNNSFFYPSVSLATVVSDYVKLPAVISFLKLRASYATVRADVTSTTVGPAPFNTITAFNTSPSGKSLFDNPLGYGTAYASPYGGPDYSLLPFFSTSKPYNNQAAAYNTTSLYDPTIKTSLRVNWEQGFDIKFLNNRLGFSATAFQYIDGPSILANSISTATGYSTYYLNALKVKKTGYEFTLNGTPVKNYHGLSWDVLVNWSTFKDVYKELPPGLTAYRTFFQVGDRTDKLYTSGFVKTADGQIVNDASGKPLANPVAQYLGNLYADYSWSVYNKLSYKGVTLGFQFDGSVGGVTTDYMHNKTMRGGRNIETAEGALGDARYLDWQNFGVTGYTGSYVGTGVVVSNGTPINYNSQTGAITNYGALQFAPNTKKALVQDYVSKYYGIDEANLMSKTFAKLREVTLGYDIPARFLKRSFISKATISFVARNLIYFYKDIRFKDVDLDQYPQGLSSTGLQSPTSRRFGFNLNVTF
ncbi:MAG: SusC/RagA family TonB-linked outer membrane protein [Bacteroidota bacterium]